MNTKKTNADGDAGKEETPFTASGVQTGIIIMEISTENSQKAKNKSTI